MNLPSILQTALQEATPIQKQRLGIATCQKLQENYRLFFEKYAFGSILLFDEILDTIIQENTKINIEVIEKQIIEICPDMEEFAGNLSASLALDACSVLMELAFFYASSDETQKEKSIQTISFLALQSIEFQILEAENWSQNQAHLTQKLEQHPIFQQELVRQVEVLNTCQF